MANVDENMDISKEFMALKESSPYSNETIHTSPDDEDDDAKYFSKKTKKKKKKKDKSYKLDKLALLAEATDIGGGDDSGEISEDDFLFMKKMKKGKKKDLFDMREAKKKKKEDYEARFNPEILKLRKILADSDSTSADIRAIFEELKSSKARGVGKMMTDLLQALNTSNSNRASIVRDIANIKRTGIDLKIKAGKNKKDKDDESKRNDEEYGVNLFNRLFQGGGTRKNMMAAAKEFYNAQDDMTDVDADDIAQDIIDERLSNESSKYRSDEGSKFIEYESQHPEYCILRHPDDNDWEVIAVNDRNERMPDDYPVLPKENLGKVSFNLDNGTATDETGRTYRVIDSPV